MANANASASASTSGGIGLAGLLTVVFVVLKLNPGGALDSPVEDWSWWWVFSPIWITWLIVLGFLALLGIGALVAVTIDNAKLKRRRKRQLEAARARKGLSTSNDQRKRRGLPPV